MPRQDEREDKANAESDRRLRSLLWSVGILAAIGAGVFTLWLVNAVPWNLPSPDSESDVRTFMRNAGETPASIAAYIRDQPDYIRTRQGLLALIWLNRTSPVHRDGARAELDSLLTELIEDRIPTSDSDDADHRRWARRLLLMEVRDRAASASSAEGGDREMFQVAKRAGAAYDAVEPPPSEPADSK